MGSTRQPRDPERWPGLELRHLSALLAVAEQGSFHRAADHLCYTQSAISQQVRALEGIVGEQLVERDTRPVRLTAAGEVVAGHAREILARAATARDDLRALHEAGEVQLRVGAFQSMGARLVPRIVSRLAEERSPLQVRFTQTTGDHELWERLRDDRLDASFVLLPRLPGPFEAIELFAEPFVALVPERRLRAGAGAISLRDLLRFPLVAPTACRCAGGVEAQANERGLEARVVHRTDDNGTLVGLVAEGDAAALAPQLVADARPAGVAAVPLSDPVPPRRIGLAWHANGGSAPLEGFVGYVREACMELGLRPVARASPNRHRDRRIDALHRAPGSRRLASPPQA